MKKLFLFLLVSLLFICFGCKKQNQTAPVITSGDTVTAEKSVVTASHYLGSSNEYKTPYFIFQGVIDTPKIIIDGGIHGDEVAGYMACDTLVRYLKVTKGTVIVIPRLNKPACLALKRGLKNDFNRSFPGTPNSSEYEFRLAFEFMRFIDSIRPVAVINHHEARNKYDPEEYKKNPDKAFGQVLITCLTPSEDMLITALNNLNDLIQNPVYKFTIQYYPIQPNHSLDNIVSKLHVKSYTVETYRGFLLPDRIKMHIQSDESFFKTIGIEYSLQSLN